jgi:branched-chain amino acid transport system permease protein
MSAAKWRSAMNSRPAGGAASARGGAARAVAAPVAAGPGHAQEVRDWLQRSVRLRHVAVLAAVLVFPWVASSFVTYQIGAQSLALGLIALSLTFLGGYGGMISLAQMTVAGIAGYAVAILGVSSAESVNLGWPWWLSVPLAILLASIVATAIGWLSVRTEGIYTIMITLAIGVAFYYLALQNYSVFNGFQGHQKVQAPTVFGINFNENRTAFYYLTLACALAGYFFVKYLLRTPFGIALQGIRDNPRRMHALGFHVVAHRVAAYAVAGLIAAVGGILFTWYNHLITPGSVGTSWLINILVIAVLGGMKHPIGPFMGAIVFVLLQTFAIDLIDRERFNLVIGGVFLAIVLFSPDGLLGWWSHLRSALRRRSPAAGREALSLRPSRRSA